MSAGFYIKGGVRVGGLFADGGRGLPKLTEARRGQDAALPAGSVVGIDLEDIRLEGFFTPETDQRQLQKIIKLQDEFHQSALKGPQERLASIVVNGETGTSVLFLTFPNVETAEGGEVYPAFAALYALASANGMVKPGKNVLLVFFHNGEVMTLTVADEAIVYARVFPDNASFGMNLRLSAQKVFFERQRYFIKLDNLVVIGDSKADAGRAANVFDAETQMEFIDASQYFADADLSLVERGGMILAAGLAAVPGIGKLSSWNLKGRPEKRRVAGKAAAFRLAAILLLALPLLFLADGLSNQALVAASDKKLAEIAPVYQRTFELMENVRLMKGFAAAAGRDIIGPDVCFALFQALDTTRPGDIAMTSIGGNLYGTVAANGTAANYNSLLTFIKLLGESPSLADCELILANSAEGGKVEFQLVLRNKFAKEFTPLKSKDDASGVRQ